MLKLTNTLSGKKEEFKSVQADTVCMYNCGPTVYDFPHIGNLRKYVFDDILRRTLEFNNFKVKQVINITDFGHLSSDADEGEDKMTKGLKREGKPITMQAMKELADFYTEKFVEDIKKLSIEQPEYLPKASEHIKEDIELIKVLEQKGFIYKISDGLYFDTSKLSDYGKLGQIQKNTEQNIEQEKEHSRIAENSDKKNPRDFAVWKFSNKNNEESSGLGFESPWGKGFPGWHIECSAMSLKYLAHAFPDGNFEPKKTQTIDIHTGGIDHIPVHHNNEIAQSEAATGKKFVNYWVHENFLNINDTKVSKSLKNFYTLKDLEEKNITPLAYRYWLLTAHYKSPVNFTWEAVQAAQTAYFKLVEFVQNISDLGSNSQNNSENTGKISVNYLQKFTDFINDDLDTPKAIALVWELIKDNAVSDSDKKATLLEFNKVLGLGLDKIKDRTQEKIEIPEEVKKIAQARDEARKNKDFKKSDELREEIKKLGFEIKDTDSGTEITLSK